MSVLPSPRQVEDCREFWAKIARENGWYKEPFFVQVWHNAYGEITDCVSYSNLDRDYVVEDEDGANYAHCADCDRTISLDTDNWIAEGDDTICVDCG